MDLAGRVALVTGGAVRVGRAICLGLSSRGCGVVIHCRHSFKQANELAAELKAQGASAWVARGSLSGEAACRSLIKRAIAAAGHLDILVNNAAEFLRHSLMEADAASWRSALATNLLAPVMLTRFFAAAPGATAIVNIIDHRVRTLDTGAFPYSISKKALEQATRMSALELAPGIRVNAVAPGPALPPEPGCVRSAREPAGRAPLSKRPTPEDVAAAVLFLLEADAITGQTIFVDGGRHLLGSES